VPAQPTGARRRDLPRRTRAMRLAGAPVALPLRCGVRQVVGSVGAAAPTDAGRVLGQAPELRRVGAARPEARAARWAGSLAGGRADRRPQGTVCGMVSEAGRQGLMLAGACQDRHDHGASGGCRAQALSPLRRHARPGNRQNRPRHLSGPRVTAVARCICLPVGRLSGVPLRGDPGRGARARGGPVPP
jgi:hypothetical protein